VIGRRAWGVKTTRAKKAETADWEALVFPLHAATEVEELGRAALPLLRAAFAPAVRATLFLGHFEMREARRVFTDPPIAETAEWYKERGRINPFTSFIHAHRRITHYRFRDVLGPALRRLSPDNAQGEYYLTDIVAMAVAEGVPVSAHVATDEREVRGVNDRAQLVYAERLLQQRRAHALLEAGTWIADPARFDVRGTLTCGRDVRIDVGCVFEGNVTLGDGVEVGAHCVLRDVEIGAGTAILPFSHLEDARVGAGCRIGPYSRLRPGAVLGDEVHIGNFVEIKASTLGRGAKANHLAYVGDSELGRDVNFGAGSITANYDGANKHRTVIGDNVHIGSNCVLVAPVNIGAGATIGGGSTIVAEAPANTLTLARARQVSIAGWKRPAKKPKAAK